MSNLKLRDLIKQVRACKTAAEERSLIARESSSIRGAVGDESGNRHRNVAKLLYIHMLGYPTHFGQMECLKLIVSSYYSDKRIGYLGLMLLLDENMEVLTLVTNSLQNDLKNPNQFVVGLALCALGNISNIGIARDCAGDVEKLLSSTNPYIRKKAALAAVRIIRKVPELSEQFEGMARVLLGETNHGVLLAGLTLMIELCSLKPDIYVVELRRRKTVQVAVRLLKTLVQSGYYPEHDVNGITDPFLQVKLLQLLRILGANDPNSAKLMNDVLAQVATNTDSIRNVGNAILYETVQTIMGIACQAGLRTLAVNILGRFLLNRDNNIRYVALNTLGKVVDTDMQAVQRHRHTIVDCLKDPDISIRRRALDLIYSLVNSSNVRILVRELLNFLVVADIQFRGDIAAKLCWVAERYAPSRRWHFDTMLRVIGVAGAFVPYTVPATLIRIIASTPEIQSYAVRRLYVALVKDQSQAALVQSGVWCIGEFGDLLISSPSGDDETEGLTVDSEQVVGLLHTVIASPLVEELSRAYVLNALAKLTTRLSASVHPLLKKLIVGQKCSVSVELQQRACEYDRLLALDHVRNECLERIPPPEEPPEKQDAHDESSTTTRAIIAEPEAFVSKPEATEGGDSLINLLGSTTPTTTVAASTSTDLLSDLFGGGAPVASDVGAPSASPLPPQQSSLNLDGLFPSDSSGQAPAPTPSAIASPQFVAFEKKGLKVMFEVTHPPGSQHTYNVLSTVTNSGAVEASAFVMRVAPAKWLKLQLQNASGNTVPANGSGQLTQPLRLLNMSNGEQPVLVRLKLTWSVEDSSFDEQADVSFPAAI